jgi:dihydroneopterin aldolase
MDWIYLHGLAVETTIGIYAWERAIKQRVVLDLELAVDIHAAAANEDINHTVSYQAVAESLTRFIEASEFLLVETMAESIAQLIMSEFQVTHVRLKLGKPSAIANARDVGVMIERSLSESQSVAK